MTEFIIIIIKLIINIRSYKILNLYNTNVKLIKLGLRFYLPQIPPTLIKKFKLTN